MAAKSCARCARSPEIISLILSYLLELGSVAPYVAVSKEWQAAVERHTFSVLHLTPARLDVCARIVTGYRRHVVRCLKYMVILDAYTDDARARVETPEEQRRNDEVFTDAIHKFFYTFSMWHVEEAGKEGIELSLLAYSPSDIFNVKRPDEFRTRFKRAKTSMEARDLLNRRFERSYLQLLKSDTASAEKEVLPVVSVVTKFKIDYKNQVRGPRRISPAAACTLASRLPRLRAIDFSFLEDGKRGVNLRQVARKELAQGFASWPSSVSDFKFYYYYPYPYGDHYSPPSKLCDSDCLSTQLRQFSQRLTSMELDHIVLSTELFWPLHLPSAPEQLPHWPHLTSIYISYLPLTPFGEWLFESGPDWHPDRNPSHFTATNRKLAKLDRRLSIFRIEPNHRLMNDFYLAAGRAVAEMPCLRNMRLQAQRSYPGKHVLCYDATASTIKLECFFTPIFEFEQAVLDVWKEAAKKHTELELEVKIHCDPTLLRFPPPPPPIDALGF